MFKDKVVQAIAEKGLGAFSIIEESYQPEPVGPEAQKLQSRGRRYRDRANMLDNRAAITHGHKRSMQLYREAKACHNLADRYFEEAEVLSHYGRKGMKWGIRRSKKQLGISKGKLKKRAKKLSDEELKSRVKRLNLEKQYVKLNQESASKTRMQRGKEEMAKIAKNSARKVAQTQSDLILKTVVDKAIKAAKKRRTPATP
jgi:NADH dehydrogenase/NADH:ubiquinone oxidoreductase subunit G